MKIPWKWKVDGKWRGLQSRGNSKNEQTMYGHCVTRQRNLWGAPGRTNTWDMRTCQPCNQRKRLEIEGSLSSPPTSICFISTALALFTSLNVWIHYIELAFVFNYINSIFKILHCYIFHKQRMPSSTILIWCIFLIQYHNILHSNLYK